MSRLHSQTGESAVPVNPYLGARRQNETKLFSDHDETSPLIAAVSAPSVACFMLAVQQQKRLCCHLPIRRRVCSTTRLPHDEACSVDRPGILVTDVRRSEIYSSVSQKRLVNQQAQLVLDPLSDWQPAQLSKSWSHTVMRLEIHSITVHAAACRTRWSGASVEAGRLATTALMTLMTSFPAAK